MGGVVGEMTEKDLTDELFLPDFLDRGLGGFYADLCTLGCRMRM